MSEIDIWRKIPVGTGGTYIFKWPYRNQLEGKPDDPTTIFNIGTNGCEHSVGVYFGVDQFRCFAADIDVRIVDNGTFCAEQCVDSVHVEGLDIVEELQRRVRGAVAAESRSSNWEADNNERFGDGLTIVCSKFEDEEGRALPSKVAADTIVAWLVEQLTWRKPLPDTDKEVEGRVQNVKRASVMQSTKGLVVKHGGGDRNYFSELGGTESFLTEPRGKEWRWVWDKRQPGLRWRGRWERDIDEVGLQRLRP